MKEIDLGKGDRHVKYKEMLELDQRFPYLFAPIIIWQVSEVVGWGPRAVDLKVKQGLRLGQGWRLVVGLGGTCELRWRRVL